MTTRFPCLSLEGGLLAADLIDQIADGTAPGQKISDFGLDGRRHLTDEIAAAWTEARTFWTAFSHRVERLSPDDPATSVTRDQWMIPFLSLLDYEPTYTPRAAEVDGQTYAISHRADSHEDAPPVHIVGCRQSLERRPESGRPRLAPHSLLQEYLNRTEHLWGLVTNGTTLRLIRDSHLIRRQAYIEFDLQQIMEAEKFADYALLYRLAHRTRLPHGMDNGQECLLERYYRLTAEQGGRVRDHLRDGVERALTTFANGFLHHPRNQALREAVREGKVKPLDFYQQLLLLIYRLLFLMVAEERRLITENLTYHQHYSITRLRRLVEERAAYTDHQDLWFGLETTFRLFQDEKVGKMLEVPPLNGDLFNAAQTLGLSHICLSNRELLTALWHLSMYRESERTPWRRINYAALDVEELGSVYESLLEFRPIFTEQRDKPVFELAAGTERKSTGSYYTPPELVNELVQSALVPIIEERLRQARERLQEHGQVAPYHGADPQGRSLGRPSPTGRGKEGEGLESVLLSIKVLDPACGSGHFLLAAARRLGKELARVRTGDDEPAPEQVRLALRDVITHCIYGVDKNPLAVDLCKVALWMEGHAKGKPLTFLDHRIRCGDSLIGVFDLAVLEKGIPDKAFDPVAGDDKAVARELKRQNRKEQEGQRTLFFSTDQELRTLADAYQQLVSLADDTPEQIRRKAEAYQKIHSQGTKWWQDNTACHLWTAAFFAELTPENRQKRRISTTDDLQRYLENPKAGYGPLVGNAWQLAQHHHFFHWPLEFPEVFSPRPLGEGTGVRVQGGFDVVLGNPPWERIKLQELEFFATRDPEIARAPNKAARERLIQELPKRNPDLYLEFQQAKHASEAQSKFSRGSDRFPLTARGDINTYAVFAELARRLLNPRGRSGIIVPTGIATDDTCKHFFGDVVEKHTLASLYDFENREALFPSVHRSYKFSLFTLRGAGDQKAQPSEFVFFATRPEHLVDKNRRFTLSAGDFRLINPNTRTCPVFRTGIDAELTKKIYQRVSALVNERTGENPWGVSFLGMFHMSNDSHLFRTRKQLEVEGFKLVGNRFVKDNEVWLPLYEAKMIHQFDHRFGSFEGLVQRPKNSPLPTPPLEQYENPSFVVQPWYWVPSEEVKRRLSRWSIGFRRNARVTDERTGIFTVFNVIAAGDSVFFITSGFSVLLGCALVATFNNIVFDFILRQKLGGTNMSFYYIEQLPILPPSAYTETDLILIVPRVLELVYTAWDIKFFADDVWRDADNALHDVIKKQWDENQTETDGHPWEPPEWVEISEDGLPLPPFKWHKDRRARLRAELDAYFARLYGLTEEELRYILDPQDVYGPDFPGETFRVLKEKELKQYGEYRTRRLVLEEWRRMFG